MQEVPRNRIGINTIKKHQSIILLYRNLHYAIFIVIKYLH